MTFNTEVVKPGKGRAIRIDISTDNFATVAYRYSDVAGELDGTNMYDARVVAMGSVRRALGNNRIAASSTTDLQFDNADGAVDWLCGRENIATAAAARFRIYVVLYDRGAVPLVFTSKLLGEFILSSWPARNNTTVELQLADDFMGKLGVGLQLPTFEDWVAVGTTSNNPIKNWGAVNGLPSSLAMTTPIQLAFGEDFVRALPHVLPVGNNSEASPYYRKVIVPLYSTADLSAVDQDLVVSLYADRFPEPTARHTLGADLSASIGNVERDVVDFSTGLTVSNWTVEKSPTITKAGIDYQIVYLVMRDDFGWTWYDGIVDVPDFNPTAEAPHAYEGGYDPAAVNQMSNFYISIVAGTKAWFARCSIGSRVSGSPTPNLLGNVTHAVDVMTDLVSVYSSASVDSTSAARVKSGVPYAACSGIVSAWTEAANDPMRPPPPLSLRQVLTRLAQSSDFDIFIDWSGQIAFASDVWDSVVATQSGSLLSIAEASISDMKQWVPSESERGAAFNRVIFTGAKTEPVSALDAPFQGPFDIEDADIPTSSRIIELSLEQGWRPFRQQALDPFQWRNVDTVTRDRIRFRINISGLQLELGQYFRITWTRGSELGGPYNASGEPTAGVVFQCESITYSPSDDIVEIEAVWRDDTTTDRQYLLDDETLLVRSKSGSGSVTTDATSNVVFGGTINLGLMGVVEGDILVLRDSAQAAAVFTRNVALRIVGVYSDTDIEVSAAVPAGVVANADWYIVCGATTYPDAISDPTNYPSGGDIYGKATDASGDYSNASQGNRLITG